MVSPFEKVETPPGSVAVKAGLSEKYSRCHGWLQSRGTLCVEAYLLGVSHCIRGFYCPVPAFHPFSPLGSSGASEFESNPNGKNAKRPRLAGEALRDELMRREREEKEAVLEVNTAFYRARAYKVGRACAVHGAFVPCQGSVLVSSSVSVLSIVCP